MPGPVIRVLGLREFVKGVKETGDPKALGKAIRTGLNKGAELLVDRAAPRVPSSTGAARSSLRPSSSQTAVRVTGGGSKAPYYPWLDFGGSTGKGHKPGKADSGSVKRKFYPDGRYLFPTFYDMEQTGEVVDVIAAELAELARASGLAVDS